VLLAALQTARYSANTSSLDIPIEHCSSLLKSRITAKDLSRPNKENRKKGLAVSALTEKMDLLSWNKDEVEATTDGHQYEELLNGLVTESLK
jgi:hypothetical protein